MRFVKTNDKFYKRTRLVSFIEEFRDSGIHRARVEDHHYCTAQCGANTIRRAAKRCGYFEIETFVRNGEIYIVNTAVEENESEVKNE